MLKDRGYHFFQVVACSPSGRDACTGAEGSRRHRRAHSPSPNIHDKVEFSLFPYQEVLTGPVKPVLYALFAALGLVLLIACANVSNLLIARCLGRQQEFAVRAALGAGKMRLIRQMLAEGLLLSLLGCGVGVLLAQLAMIAIHKLPEDTIPRGDSIAIHWTVVLVLAAIAILTTVLSSLLPALLVARSNPQVALQAASRGVGSRSVGGRLSGWLVAGEVALSTLLLVGTGLLFRTLWNLEQARLGFETAHVTMFSAMPADSAGFSQMAVSEDTSKCACLRGRRSPINPSLSACARCPGVESAALVTAPPLSRHGHGLEFRDSEPPQRRRPTHRRRG